MTKRILLLSTGLLALPFLASAATFDLALDQANTSLTVDRPIVSQNEKLYATIQNAGTQDVEGEVIFLADGVRIGGKPISVRAGGKAEEAWVNWVPTTVGNHVLTVQVTNDPDFPDATPENNETHFTVFVDHDTDGDGTPDYIDTDADNDGVYNFQEVNNGTNSFKKDTDGDGVGDKQDAYPLDPTRSSAEAAPVVQPVAPKTEDAPKTSATTLGDSSGTVVIADQPDSASSGTAVGDLASRTTLFPSTNEDATAPEAQVAGEKITDPEAAPTDQLALNGGQIVAEAAKQNATSNGAFDLSRYLWPAAGTLAFLTLLFLFLARRKREEQEELILPRRE